MNEKTKFEIERSLAHIGETNNVRKIFWSMDDKVENLLYGIRQGDDAIVVGDIVVNMEGPYPINIGRKTGLIHTCSDVVVMGARPLFATNAMQVNSIKEASEVAKDIKKQSDGIKVPIIGGNTQLLKDLLPCISFTVVGKLIKPIPDSNLQPGDKIYMLGEVVEGEIGDRVNKANIKFETFFELIDKLEIHSAKDCSRGGWFGNLIEMVVKSRKGVLIKNIPYSDFSKYLGNYLISTKDEKILDIALKHKCPITEIAEVTDELSVKIGSEVVLNEKKILGLIDKIPFHKSHKKV